MSLNPIKCTIPGVNPKVNYGWATMMYQCRCISCSKCATVVGDVGNGGGYAYVGAEDMGKSLYLLLNIAINVKWLLKIFYLIKNVPRMER